MLSNNCRVVVCGWLWVLLWALSGCAERPPGQLLVVTQAKVKQPVPGTDKSVGYFELTNPTDQARTLVAVRSPQVRAIEMHTTEEVDGMMRMRRLPSVDVGAGATVRFAPGGRHLMLFGVTELHDPVPLTLVFADELEIEVVAQLVPFSEVLDG